MVRGAAWAGAGKENLIGMRCTGLIGAGVNLSRRFINYVFFGLGSAYFAFAMRISYRLCVRRALETRTSSVQQDVYQPFWKGMTRTTVGFEDRT